MSRTLLTSVSSRAATMHLGMLSHVLAHGDHGRENLFPCGHYLIGRQQEAIFSCT
jgi:hypothetical protein